MERTQIYLTKRQRNELTSMAKASGRKQSELIREAVDRYIDEAGSGRQKTVLARAAGLWRDRSDLPDFRSIRSEWDRT